MESFIQYFRTARAERLAVAMLLAIYAGLAFSASLHKGVSFDEGEQLAVGYNIWREGDFRMEGANGDLIKRWATLPFLVTRPQAIAQDNLNWRQAQPYDMGFEFLFRTGNKPEWLLAQGRAMTLLLGLATGLLIHRLSRRIFGVAGGLVSLALFVFSPSMLTFGGLVSTEMSITLTLLAATWCIWRLLHEITPGRVVGSVAVFGLALLAKPTAFVIFPVTAVLVAVAWFGRRPWIWRWRGRARSLTTRGARLAALLALVMAHAAGGWAAIWAHYDFRYEANPSGVAAGVLLDRYQTVRDPVNPRVSAFIAWANHTHLFPEGYLRGIDWLLGQDDRRVAFLDGEWKIGGWWDFFPRAMWWKTPPAKWLVLALAAVSAWLACRRPRAPADVAARGDGAAGPEWRETVPFIVLFAVYFTVAINQNLNIGHRHILPAYPALSILAGAAGLAWTQRRRMLQIGTGLALTWLAADVVAIYPYFLGYFSPVGGGPRHGYQHLVDSSLGWGMNLPSLKRWLDEKNPGNQVPVFLSYFGADSPDYHGIVAKRLPGFFDWRTREYYPLTPGYYVISASLLQSVYTRVFGPWNAIYEQAYQQVLGNILVFDATARDPVARADLLARYPAELWAKEYAVYEDLRLARLCAWLRHKGGEPQHQIGYAMCIWRLDQAQLDEALRGPPVEMAPQALGSIQRSDAP